MTSNTTGHKYKKEQSIIYGLTDDYQLSENEFFLIYSFFVTYSLCGNQSMKKRSFIDYGWDTVNISNQNQDNKKSSIGKLLESILDLNHRKDKFCFMTDKTVFKDLLTKCNLEDGQLTDFDTERVVIGKTTESNKYLKLFYRIRNGLAHGRFILKYSSDNQKMIIIQDNDTYNVTARIVLKLSTLLSFVEQIDLNGLITNSNENMKTTSVA